MNKSFCRRGEVNSYIYINLNPPRRTETLVGQMCTVSLVMDDFMLYRGPLNEFKPLVGYSWTGPWEAKAEGGKTDENGYQYQYGWNLLSCAPLPCSGPTVS